MGVPSDLILQWSAMRKSTIREIEKVPRNLPMEHEGTRLCIANIIQLRTCTQLQTKSWENLTMELDLSIHKQEEACPDRARSSAQISEGVLLTSRLAQCFTHGSRSDRTLHPARSTIQRSWCKKKGGVASRTKGSIRGFRSPTITIFCR